MSCEPGSELCHYYYAFGNCTYYHGHCSVSHLLKDKVEGAENYADLLRVAGSCHFSPA